MTPDPTREEPVRIRIVQQVATGESPRQRMDVMREAVLADPFPSPEAAPERVENVVVLPEMWPVGFFNFDGYQPFAREFFGEYQQLVVELASTLDAWVFGGSAPAQVGSEYRNRSVVSSPSGDLHHFDKLHLFTYQSREAEVLTAGSSLVAFDTPLGRTGILTCFDLRFPEAFRALRRDSCDAFVVTAAWPAPRVAHWKALLVARAIENQAWVVGVNGTGVDFGTELGGGSMVVAPDGTVLTNLDDEAQSPDVLISASLARQVRDQMPFHRSTLPALLERLSTFSIVDGS